MDGVLVVFKLLSIPFAYGVGRKSPNYCLLFLLSSSLKLLSGLGTSFLTTSVFSPELLYQASDFKAEIST